MTVVLLVRGSCKYLVFCGCSSTKIGSEQRLSKMSKKEKQDGSKPCQLTFESDGCEMNDKSWTQNNIFPSISSSSKNGHTTSRTIKKGAPSMQLCKLAQRLRGGYDKTNLCLINRSFLGGKQQKNVIVWWLLQRKMLQKYFPNGTFGHFVLQLC